MKGARSRVYAAQASHNAAARVSHKARSQFKGSVTTYLYMKLGASSHIRLSLL
jgi:hypothetical protein